VPVDLEIGKAQIIKDGEKVAIWALGPMVYSALEASEILATKGMNVMIVNPRFIKPLDKGLLRELLEKEYRILTVEDHVLQGGFGSAVAEAILELEFPLSGLECLGIPDEFVEHGKRSSMFKKYGLDAEGIARAAIKQWEMDEEKVELIK
jgi:1-deoxy-D-xylulose-5-phosphate synthase